MKIAPPSRDPHGFLQLVRTPCHEGTTAGGREAPPDNGLPRAADDGLALLVPDVLVPAQVFAGFRHRARIERERLLMLAVLADGVKCYKRYAFAHDPQRRQIFAETLEWVISSDSGQLFSFETICDVLDIDAEHVRRALRQWYERAQQARAGRRVSRGGRLEFVAQTCPALNGHPVRRRVVRVRGGAGDGGPAHRAHAR